MGHETLYMVIVVKACVMDNTMPYSFLHRILCDIFEIKQTVNGGRACVIVTPITHGAIQKTVCDVDTNGNICLGFSVWDVQTNGNVCLVFTVWDVHMNRNVCLGFTVWDVHMNGNVCVAFSMWDVLTYGNDWACIIVCDG